MTIVDKINEKTGKFAGNIADAVSDLLGKERTSTNIKDVIGDGANIQEAIDGLADGDSANIMQAVDNYNGDDYVSATIEDALENTEPSESNESTPDFESMTKAELQAYADEHNIEGVNQNTQTKEEMIAAIVAAIS